MATQAEPTQHVLGLIRTLKISVNDLLRVTAERLEETQSQDPNELAAFLETRAASKEQLIATAAGEALTVDTVCALLQIGNAAVHKAKDEGRILAYQVPGKRHYLFPAFQFEGGAVARWVPELIEIVGNGFAALHFLTVDRKSLTKQSFLTLLLRAESPDSREAIGTAILKKARTLQP